MLDSIIPLGSNVEAGGKSNGLGTCIAHGIPVPKGYIIPHQFLTDLLMRSGRYEEFVHATQGEYVLYRSSLVQNILETLEMDEPFLQLLKNLCAELSNKLIVRSSADNEDTLSSSMAGIYESLVTKGTPTDLWCAIRECWVAAYSSRVLTLMGEYPKNIHLIVQEFIEFDQSGIVFSSFQDALGSEECIRVEMVEGDCAQLVDGIREPSIYQFRRDEEPPGDQKMSQEVLLSLQSIIFKLERIMGCSVDLEWGVRQGQLSITQCRPITRSTQMQVDHGSWWNEEQMHSLLALPYQSCKETIEHHVKKKFWTRLVLKKHNIRTATIGFFCYHANLLTDANIKEIVAHCKTSLIELRTDQKYVRIPNEPQVILKTLLEKPFASQEGMSTVCITEFPLAEKSGYSKVVEDRIIIEVILGGFNGMWKDGGIPTRYEVKIDGQLMSSDIQQTSFLYTYDLQHLRWGKQELPERKACELKEEEIAQIVHLTNTLESKFSNVSVEWTSSSQEGGVTYFDLSKESNSSFSCDGNVLSNGFCQGTIKRISADALDPHFKTIHEINIIPTTEYIEKTNSIDFQNAILQLIGIEKPIIVTEFPKRSLAPLIPYVNGFVFQKGAALCHLSILLREAGLPAVISSEMYETLKEGEDVMITGETILLIEGRAQNETVRL